MSVVVVGNGMAGARFATQLRAIDPRRPVVVFGAEPARAYNRVLLSDVLAGKAVEDDLALAEPTGALDLRTDVRVAEIDPVNRTVVADDGSRTHYDALVLATGSRPVVPPIKGLSHDDGTLIAGAATFRTLADCRRILAAASTARSAVVLGGGLLGLEAARGLAARGLDVRVVHARGHLMERQLDVAASGVLVGTLDSLGVDVRLDASTTEVLGGDRVRGVRLDDGTELPADLLVVACGVVPDTDLAVNAGLRVDRGIVVDDRMRTSDPAVYAIGDCAEHAGRVYGLVAPAWDQARIAADVICGRYSRYSGSRLVTRLKAAGIDLASLGDPHADDGSAEVVTFADPARGTYQKVVIRDRRLVGAIMLGDNPTVGAVTQMYDRDSPVPTDPRSLLFGRTAGQGGGGSASDAPGDLTAGTTVCRCNGVTAGTILRAVAAGARTPTDVATATRASTGCGGCRDTIEDFLAHLAADPAAEPEEVVA